MVQLKPKKSPLSEKQEKLLNWLKLNYKWNENPGEILEKSAKFSSAAVSRKIKASLSTILEKDVEILYT